MIGQIKGKIIHREPPLLTIDVQGIGYEVFSPMNTFYDLAADQETITLITHLIIRDDHHALYGFKTYAERELFRHLIKVNGVGPKLALTILSGMENQQFAHHIINNDITALIKIPGIGKKTAERLIIEMRSKLENSLNSPSPSESISPSQSLDDAIRALHSLGYKPQEAKRAVQLVHQPEHSSEKLIRLALQQMAKG
jgi:holliday junction DNA helicase RuvA